jgi:hypothetical protein
LVSLKPPEFGEVGVNFAGYKNFLVCASARSTFHKLDGIGSMFRFGSEVI